MIGINHNGSLDFAIELADKAIKCGAEIIKHQTHLPEFEMIKKEAKKSFLAILQKIFTTSLKKIAYQKMMKNL